MVKIGRGRDLTGFYLYKGSLNSDSLYLILRNLNYPSETAGSFHEEVGMETSGIVLKSLVVFFHLLQDEIVCWSQWGFVCSYTERFSFNSSVAVIGFASTTLYDWLKNLAPHFQPIRSKTKTNRDSFAVVFPRLASATCMYLLRGLIGSLDSLCPDWSVWLLWFWFYDAQLKTALLTFVNVNKKWEDIYTCSLDKTILFLLSKKRKRFMSVAIIQILKFVHSV